MHTLAWGREALEARPMPRCVWRVESKYVRRHMAYHMYRMYACVHAHNNRAGDGNRVACAWTLNTLADEEEVVMNVEFIDRKGKVRRKRTCCPSAVVGRGGPAYSHHIGENAERLLIDGKRTMAFRAMYNHCYNQSGL